MGIMDTKPLTQDQFTWLGFIIVALTPAFPADVQPAIGSVGQFFAAVSIIRLHLGDEAAAMVGHRFNKGCQRQQLTIEWGSKFIEEGGDPHR